MACQSPTSFLIPFGQKHFRVTLDAEQILPKTPAPIVDEIGAVREALRKPNGTKPLAEIARPGEQVAILVNDITRLTRTDLMLPPIVETLNQAGIPDSDILVVFALGLHRKPTEEERRQIVGDALSQRLRLIDHDAWDKSKLVTIGQTSFGNVVEINRLVWEADRIILTGEIIYHLIAGYSGGRKSLVPGVAGFGTTTFNHRMILDPRCRSGVLDGNPAHEDLLEACRLVEPDFIVNVVVTPDGKLARVVAGHYEIAHRAGCEAVDALFRTTITEPYNLIIASAGGYPLDIDLRQAHKGLENACQALRPGGSILFYAECSNGSGSQVLEEFLRTYENDSEMKDALHKKFVVGGHKAYWIARLGRRYDIHLVSTLDPSLVERCHLQSVSPANHEIALQDLLRKAGPSGRVGVMPYGAFTLPVVEQAKEAVWK